MFASHINKDRNEVIINYDGKNEVVCDITGMRFIKGKLHIRVKYPPWFCNGVERYVYAETLLEKQNRLINNLIEDFVCILTQISGELDLTETDGLDVVVDNYMQYLHGLKKNIL